MKNLRKHRNIRLATIEERRTSLVKEPTYHTTHVFFRKIFSNRNEMKTQIFMNKPVYLGLSILEESNMAIYDFWYDYVKPKCGEKLRLYLFKL